MLPEFTTLIFERGLGSAILLMVLYLKVSANPDLWVMLKCDSSSSNDHVSNSCDRIRSNVALLQKCGFCISRKADIMFYHHFMFCRFTYGMHICCGMTPTSYLSTDYLGVPGQNIREFMRNMENFHFSSKPDHLHFHVHRIAYSLHIGYFRVYANYA